MKSSKIRFLVFALLLAIAVAVAFILLRPKEEVAETDKRPPPKPAASVASSVPAVNSTASATNQTSDPIYEKIKAEREQKLQKFFNAPIDFYGKVVDESNQPISGASTYYIVASASFSGSPTLDGPKTDVNGLFSITGKRGPDFSVWVEHPDYYKTESADRRFEYARRDYMPGKEPPLPPTRDNPAIFVLRKKGIAESLIHHRRIKTKLAMNGTPVAVNIRSGKADGGSNEALTFVMKSDGDSLPLNEFYPFDWSVHIQVPNGGLVERSDALNFQAPANGYVPEVTIEMPASLPTDQWKSDIQRDYFVRFRSGNYGRIQLRISGDKGRSIAETFLNPNPGSRNLEFDPNKVVQSP